MAGTRRAKVELTGDASGLRRATDDARRQLRAYGRDAARELKTRERERKRAEKHWDRARGRGAGMLAGVAGFGLGMATSLLGGEIDDVRSFEQAIARLAIAQGKTNEQMSPFRREVTRISKDLGIGRDKVMAGVTAYQALTGDTKGAAEAMELFARVSVATGAATDEVATTAAALRQNLKIDPKDLEAAFDVLNAQGKAGAIELRDLASEMATLAAGFQRFKGSAGVGGMSKLGAALQIVRRGFGSSSEAATGLESLMGAIIKNASKLEKADKKIRIFDRGKGGKKQLRDFASIIESISNSKLMKDPTALSKALGRQEAETAFQTLAGNWKDFQDLLNVDSTGSIGKDAKQFLESDAGKMEKAFNDIKLAIAEAFSPEVIKAFAQGLEAVAKGLGVVVKGIQGTIEGWDELLHGKSYEKQVDEVRERRRGERLKQIESDPSLSHWGSEERRRRAEEQLRAEDAMEDRIRDLGTGKAQMFGTGGNVAAITEMLNSFKSDQVNRARQLAGPALLKAVAADQAYASSSAPTSDVQAARESQLRRAAESSDANGADASDVMRFAQGARPEVVARYFAQALTNAMKNMNVKVSIDGADADAKARTKVGG